VEIRTLAYDHPDAMKLIAEVQQVYVARYGTQDLTPVDPAEFSPPGGLFLVGYDGRGSAVACGGWRRPVPSDPAVEAGDLEMKRLYVPERARGNGHAREMLAAIERTAAAAGGRRMILETGVRQPEAIALYESAGYVPMAKFGVYRDDPLSACYCKPLR
jgi:GNAT superfamily N-acetyltransferase